MIEALGTISHSLNVARLINHEDGAGGTAPPTFAIATKGDFANMPTGSGTNYSGALDLFERSVYTTDKQAAPVAPVLKPNGIEFFFAGGSAAGKEFGWELYAWRNGNGMARHVATGTGILGTQAVVKWPHDPNTAVANMFWADTLTVTMENWLKPIKSTDTVGNNTVASIWTDNCGYRYWYIVITGADGETGDEAGNVSVYWGYF